MRIETALFLFTSLLIAAPSAAGTLTGAGQAIDGDTIIVGKSQVRLQGVNAPEVDEPFADEALEFMGELVNDKPVVCELDGTVNRKRVIGICRVDGQDIGAAIIAAGLARDCPRYSKGRYQSIETDVARRRVGEKPYCRRR